MYAIRVETDPLECIPLRVLKVDMTVVLGFILVSSLAYMFVSPEFRVDYVSVLGGKGELCNRDRWIARNMNIAPSLHT